MRGGITLSLLLASGTAAAAPPDKPPSNEARADELFKRAEHAFDTGDYARACADFSESLKLGPKLGTLLNLALCHETVGKLVTAWSEFSHAAAWAAQNNQRDRLDFATKHVRALEPKLPRVVLQLPPDRAIEALDLDGEPVPEQRWYLPLYLDPGEHRIAVFVPGKQRTATAFRVTNAPGDQLVLVPSPPDEPGATTKKAAPPPPVRKDDTLAYVGLGAGAVGFAVGTAFGLLAATGNESAAGGRAAVATVSFVVGAASAGAGGYVLWSNHRSRGVASAGGIAVTF